MANIKIGYPALIGDTALVRVDSLSQLTGCNILLKCEHLNPGGSIKDRAAKFIVDDAERRGLLFPNLTGVDKNTIVEGTAGNTGIGLALMGRARGYRVVIVMPNNQSEEKITLLRALGADVELVPPAPFADTNNYYHVAKRRAAELRGYFADQFENVANSDAHFDGTGPEIWRDTDGKLDGFICAAGTGGTIGGVSAFLKSKRKEVHTAIVDCEGSSLLNHVRHGNLDASGSSILEGIGIRRITANFARAQLDSACVGTDVEAINMLHFLLRNDGLYVGGSAALNAVGAVKLARQLGKGKTIVSMLCDGAARYQSRLLNAEWLAQKNFTIDARNDLSFVS